MKKCPVCGSVSFDDAEVCYGCMHRFEPEEVVDASEPVAEPPDRLELPFVAPRVCAESNPDPGRLSGRATLRRRGQATMQVEPDVFPADAQEAILLPDGVRYELVVSLKPVRQGS